MDISQLSTAQAAIVSQNEERPITDHEIDELARQIEYRIESNEELLERLPAFEDRDSPTVGMEELINGLQSA